MYIVSPELQDYLMGDSAPLYIVLVMGIGVLGIWMKFPFLSEAHHISVYAGGCIVKASVDMLYDMEEHLGRVGRHAGELGCTLHDLVIGFCTDLLVRYLHQGLDRKSVV